MKIVLLLLLVFTPHLCLSSFNLDSCKTNFESLLNVSIAKNKKINLEVNEVMFQGQLMDFTETGMEGRIAWSVHEVELEHAYRSPMFASHILQEGDRVFVNDSKGNLITEGYYAEKFVDQVVLFQGRRIKIKRNLPLLYKDKKLSQLNLDTQGFIKLFNQRNSATLIKKREHIPDFILEELLIGQRIYDLHMSNPNRFVEIGSGQIIELKPNHELAKLKIDRDIEKKYGLDKFFLVNPETGVKVAPLGRVFIVNQDGSVDIIETLFHNVSQRLAFIAQTKPKEIWFERKNYYPY